MIVLEIAKIWHRIFAEHLELAMIGLVDETLELDRVCDDTKCKLGVWLNGAGHALANLATYTELVTAHQQFHQAACELLSRASEVSETTAPEFDVAKRFRETSVAVQRAIDHLAADIPAQGDALSYQSFYTQPTEAPETSWDESLTIGIPVLDEQHKSISAILDRLLAAPDALLNSESATDMLTELGSILHLHLSAEEHYLKQSGMPLDEVEAHMRRHTEILEQYANINFDAMTRRILRVRDAVDIIRTWAIEHIVEYDFSLRQYYLPTSPSQTGKTNGIVSRE